MNVDCPLTWSSSPKREFNVCELDTKLPEPCPVGIWGNTGKPKAGCPNGWNGWTWRRARFKDSLKFILYFSALNFQLFKLSYSVDWVSWWRVSIVVNHKVSFRDVISIGGYKTKTKSCFIHQRQLIYIYIFLGFSALPPKWTVVKVSNTGKNRVSFRSRLFFNDYRQKTNKIRCDEMVLEVIILSF